MAVSMLQFTGLSKDQVDFPNTDEVLSALFCVWTLVPLQGTLVYVFLCHFVRAGVTFHVSGGCLLLEGDLYNGLTDK